MKEVKDLLQKLEPVIGKKAKGLWYLNILSSDGNSFFNYTQNEKNYSWGDLVTSIQSDEFDGISYTKS